ncbi:hypothetical protein F5Y17DRAFT_414952 [Xylariaceae sp. FL0594]|nr:hypothetical protein F5Y17DRAFT_414952 [Xylariaceae sp. FL0594]
MDRIASRFGRSKRGSPTAHLDECQTGSPTATNVNAERSRFPLEHRSTLPSLTITTSPLTTPPSSSHSQGPVPRSPLRSFSQFRAAHKRARSPASVQPRAFNSSFNTAQGHGFTDQSRPLPKRAKEPQLPFFLNRSPEGIRQQFDQLNDTPRPYLHAYTDRDRYSDIRPYANNRVQLPVPEGKFDYINASPIVSPSPLRPDTRPELKYIAMQGPKEDTIGHTWRMVAHMPESPVVMVMLTKTTDAYGHGIYYNKCAQYYPSQPKEVKPFPNPEYEEQDEFGDGFRGYVECLSLEKRHGGDIEVRQLKLHVEGHEDTTTIWHLLYTKWPDHGVPEGGDYDSFFELMKLSRELNSSTNNPRIIHCSAGVGRTGTFIALETLMREIDEGAMDRLDPDVDVTDNDNDPIYRAVDTLREQRLKMVQDVSQYKFIHQVLRRQWLDRHGFEGTGQRRRTPLGVTTVAQARRTSRGVNNKDYTRQLEADSSDDSATGGVSLRD